MHMQWPSTQPILADDAHQTQQYHIIEVFRGQPFVYPNLGPNAAAMVTGWLLNEPIRILDGLYVQPA